MSMEEAKRMAKQGKKRTHLDFARHQDRLCAACSVFADRFLLSRRELSFFRLSLDLFLHLAPPAVLEKLEENNARREWRISTRSNTGAPRNRETLRAPVRGCGARCHYKSVAVLSLVPPSVERAAVQLGRMLGWWA